MQEITPKPLYIQRKIMIIILLFTLCFFIIRIFSSYTIITAPYFFGTMAYSGGAKHRFLKCIINPITITNVKRDIINYVENSEEVEAFSKEAIDRFFGSLKCLSDFNIISYNANPSPYFGKSEETFLLQAKGLNKPRGASRGPGMCVVFRDKKTKQILRFRD